MDSLNFYHNSKALERDLRMLTGYDAKSLIKQIDELIESTDNPIIHKHLKSLYASTVFALGLNVLECMED